MPLLNILLRKKIEIIIILLALTFIGISLYPIFKVGIDAAFFSIDPDAVYFGNVISYIRTNKIYYFNHPGTPAIVLLANSFWIFRIYAKFIAGLPFAEWSFLNISYLFMYSRLIQALLVFVALIFIFKAVYSYSKSLSGIVFVFLAFLNFQPILRSANIITTDATSMLIVSVWFLLLVFYLKTKNILIVYVLTLIAGFAFSSRINNLVLIPSSIFLLLLRKDIKLRLIHSLLLIAYAIVGFVNGVLPILSKMDKLYRWFILLVTSSGVQGQGEQAVFNLQKYLSASREMIKSQWHAFIILLLILAILIVTLITHQMKKMSFELPVIIFSLMVIILFAKYPLDYYQLSNYVVLVVTGSLLLKYTSKSIRIIITVFLLIWSINSVKIYWNEYQRTISNTALFEQYLRDHPADNIVWEFGRSKEFSYVWIRGWAETYKEEIQKFRSGLYSISEYNTYSKVLTPFGNNQEIFSVCWDKFYIQSSLRDKFIKLYSQKYPLTFEEISGTDMSVIFSGHCNN